MAAAFLNNRKTRPMTTSSRTFTIDNAKAVPGSSATAQVVDALRLYGHHPEDGEPDPRPLPETADLDAMLAGIYAAFIDPLLDTALEPDLADVLWSLTDLFHRKADRVQRQLDDNEMRQRDSQALQDGSEIRSVELERLLEQGRAILERRSAFEHMRDEAADHYESHTGMAWRPRTGSLVNHKHLTASMVDSRDFIAAKRRAETEMLLPTGPKIAFGGGVDCNDHERIWATLDKVLAKHPAMVLLHGGSPRGAEKIAACWAASRKIVDVPFKPDWTREGKAAPFKRNDRMLDVVPIGLVVFPGSGITDNLADKAKRLGVPLVDCRGVA
jgi:hypothetical protein